MFVKKAALIALFLRVIPCKNSDAEKRLGTDCFRRQLTPGEILQIVEKISRVCRRGVFKRIAAAYRLCDGGPAAEARAFSTAGRARRPVGTCAAGRRRSRANFLINGEKRGIFSPFLWEKTTFRHEYSECSRYGSRFLQMPCWQCLSARSPLCGT